VITEAAAEVGPALFFSLLIITLSFIPVFTLQAQEGRLFRPLAFTKTYAMAAAAILSVTLIPVLMGYLIRGQDPRRGVQPDQSRLTAAYRPALDWVMRKPRTTLAIAVLAFATTAWPLAIWGLSSCPTWTRATCSTCPRPCRGCRRQGRQLLQQTDRMIKTVPEVESVFGKAGRAESATDPAPLEMFETTIRFKPRDQWRPGMTPDKLVAELDAR
jgi:Cu(I)/Ag(I) efflux system membrane protein CusA/SilA